MILRRINKGVYSCLFEHANICSFYSSSKERQNQTHINLGNIFNHVANKYEKRKKKKRTNYKDRIENYFDCVSIKVLRAMCLITEFRCESNEASNLRLVMWKRSVSDL